MPCDYSIEDLQSCLTVTLTGSVRVRELLLMIDRVDADPRYRDGMDEFFDLTQLERIAITEVNCQRLSQLIIGLYRRRRPPGKVACLAPSMGPPPSAIVRYGQALLEATGTELRIFNSRREAFLFLPAPPSAGATRIH